MTYMGTPQHKNPCPGGHEIYNSGRPYLGHHYCINSLFDLCMGVEKILKEIHQINTFYPKITSPAGGGGLEILQFLVALPYRCYIPKVKIGPVVLEKNMLTHDGRRRTPTHSNRSPELLNISNGKYLLLSIDLSETMLVQ